MSNDEIFDGSEHLLKVFKLVPGGASGVARLFDPSLSATAVLKWVRKGVPPTRVPTIESAVDGAVTRYQLRPDIYGDDPRLSNNEAA